MPIILDAQVNIIRPSLYKGLMKREKTFNNDLNIHVSRQGGISGILKLTCDKK